MGIKVFLIETPIFSEENEECCVVPWPVLHEILMRDCVVCDAGF